jgi:DNA-binding MarR family transcriptional regulator
MRPDSATAATGDHSTEASRLRGAVLRFARRLRNQRAIDTMSDGQLAVLGWLKMRGPHTLGELAERERVSAPSMNRTVNCLEESGFLQRSPDDADRRKVNVSLTDAGHEIVVETGRRRDAWLDDALAELTAHERATLAAAAEIMTRMADR